METQSVSAKTKRPSIRNGVDLEALHATIEAIQGRPSLARFQFRAENRWLDGGHSRSTIRGFYGAGTEDTSRKSDFKIEADEPPVLLGRNQAANPGELLLHSLAACLTGSIVYHAAARGIEIRGLRSSLSGDLDLRGFLGLSKDVRKGYQRIEVRFEIETTASVKDLMECAMFSPVYEMVSASLPVNVVINVK